MPVDISIDPTAGLLLDHIPPGVASEYVVDVLTVIVPPQPVIAAGIGFTCTGVSVLHPVANVYRTMALPSAAPVITPVNEPIPAMDGALLVQVPPGEAFASVAVAPRQMLYAPVMGAGSGFTVIGALAVQPDDTVYITVPVPGTLEVTLPLPPPRLVTVTSVQL